MCRFPGLPAQGINTVGRLRTEPSAARPTQPGTFPRESRRPPRQKWPSPSVLRVESCQSERQSCPSERQSSLLDLSCSKENSEPAEGGHQEVTEALPPSPSERDL